MKTLHSIPSLVLPTALALALAFTLLAAPSAHAAIEVTNPQVEIEAKFVEISGESIRQLGFDHVGDYKTVISHLAQVPGGVSPQALGTFPVTPPAHLPATGDILMKISPEVLRLLPARNHTLENPRVTTASGQKAATQVLRDLSLVYTPKVSSDRSTVTMAVTPLTAEFNPWSVDVFGTVAFGHADRSVTRTHDVIVKDTRTVERPITVRVPFDNGQQIVDREEIRLVPTRETTKHTGQVSETRTFNRLGDVAGGGGLRVNYMLNPRVGFNVRGEVLDGECDPLGLVAASIFGEYPCCWPVTPTYSLGGGVLFPRARAVLDVGLGLKKQVTPDFSVFSEAHLITDFGRTTFGEFNVGASFPLGRKTTAAAETGSSTATAEPSDRPPAVGDIPVLAHVFREHGKPAEKADLVIFVTPRLVQPGE